MECECDYGMCIEAAVFHFVWIVLSRYSIWRPNCMADRWTQTLRADAVVWDRMWELDLCKDHDISKFLESAFIVVAAGLTVIAAPAFLTGVLRQDPPKGQPHASAAKRVVASIRVAKETFFI